MLWLDITNFIEILSNDKDPAFWPESHCPFYTLPNGKLSCYADQSVQTLKVMLENNGDFNADRLIQHYLNYFGNPESPYQIALIIRRNMKWPVDGPWLHGMFDISSNTF